MRNPVLQANRILDKYDEKHRPVNLNSLIEKLGLQLHEKDLDEEVAGMLFHEGDQFVIVVNKNHAPPRKRFTIAHEIAHYVLHREIISNVHIDKGFKQKLFRDGRSKLGEDLLEIEANKFAAELLMPSELLKKDVKNVYLDLFDGPPQELADQYEVSKQAMSIKLVELSKSFL